MSTQITMPQQGLTEESSVIAEWYVKEGDSVSVGTPLFAIETGKATFDVESEAAGTVLAIFAAEGDDVPIKTTVCIIGEPGESFERPAGAPSAAAAPAAAELSAPVPAGPAALAAAPAAGAPTGGSVFASPRAKAAAARGGLNWQDALPTGPEGRVIERDIAALAAGHGRPAVTAGETAVPVSRMICIDSAHYLKNVIS